VKIGKYAFVLLALGAVALGLELYTRTPAVDRLPVLDLPDDAQVVTLVIHGSQDGDDPLLPAIVAALGQRYRDQPRAVVRLVDWAPASDQRLRAAASARKIGHALGAQLAGLADLKELRLVAHSSGAYMPDAICESYRRTAMDPARVEMEFLDPFQIEGFFDWTHGARNHGRCADFALALVNTDDNAPATNRPLANAFNLDITAVPARRSFPRSGHYWALQYYLDQLAGQPGPGQRNHDREPRGTVTIAPWQAVTEGDRIP
jgi:hypothetical protein